MAVGAEVELDDGSPAHAGIDPASPIDRLADARFPRTRGDRPQVAAVVNRPSRVPPHTRG